MTLFRIKLFAIEKMNGLFRFRRRRMTTYCLGLGFAIGLGDMCKVGNGGKKDHYGLLE